MPHCGGGPPRVHVVLLSLVCQQARSLLKGSDWLDSSVAHAVLSLEVCCRCTLHDDRYEAW